MFCSVCNVTLVPGYHEGMRIDVCPSCRGCFLAHDAVTRAVHDQRVPRPAVEQQLALAEATSQIDPARERDAVQRCPVCDLALRRYIYAVTSGVVVDACDQHGLWLEEGELERIEAWSEAVAGGAHLVREEHAQPPSALAGARTVAVAIEIAASPAAVWPYVARVELYPTWLAHLQQAEIISGAGVGRVQRLRFANAYETKQQVTSLRPDHAISWRDAHEETNIALMPITTGTRVTFQATRASALPEELQRWIATSLERLAVAVTTP